MDAKKEIPQEFTEWEPKSHNSHFEKYQNQCVVIVTRHGGKKGQNMFLLTKKVLSMLGNPDFVGVATRGNNTFIISKTEKDDKKYAVQKPETSKLARVSAHSYIDAFGIRAGVYNAVFDAGMIQFDRLQTPSSI